MKLSISTFVIAIGAGLATALYQGFTLGWQNIDMYRVGFISVITLVLISVSKLRAFQSEDE